MDYSVRHAIPGRLRLHIAALFARPLLAQDLQDWTGRQAGVRSARVNPDCACLIIEYDPAQRVAFGELMVLLRGLRPDQLRALAGDGANGNGTQLAQRRRQAPAQRRRLPLLWPSVSLLLSFSRNPLLVGINAPLLIWNAIPIYKRAWKVWSRESRLNIDFLDALAIAASIGAAVHYAVCAVSSVAAVAPLVAIDG